MAIKTREQMVILAKGDPSYAEGIEDGRVSVLRDFDAMCVADAFVGFTTEEWAAIKKFFTFNKELSGWDK